MKTLKLRIKDKHIDQLNRLSGSVNFVWNYVNDLSYKHLQKTGKFLSAYDLNEYTKGSKVVSSLRRQNLTGEPTTQSLNENRLAGYRLNNRLLSTSLLTKQAKKA